jgi:hypothetical protein
VQHGQAGSRGKEVEKITFFLGGGAPPPFRECPVSRGNVISAAGWAPQTFVPGSDGYWLMEMSEEIVSKFPGDGGFAGEFGLGWMGGRIVV